MGSSTVQSSPDQLAKPDQYFATTHWSAVFNARANDTARAGAALEELCRTYWSPVYAYVCRRGYSSHDAQDLTQGFFQCLLERQSFANADPQKGRFRSFILGAVKHFLAKERARLQTQKRGGDQTILSLDHAQEKSHFEPVDPATEDQNFDKEWAAALLQKVLNTLQDDYRRDSRGELFDVLKQTLTGAREHQPYARLAAQLNTNEGAVKTAVHRLRKRYRQLLESEIAGTVATPAEVKEELSYLLAVVSGK